MVSLPEVEARIQQELEEKMKREFGEKERRLQEEHLRKLEREKQEKEEQLRSVPMCPLSNRHVGYRGNTFFETRFPVCNLDKKFLLSPLFVQYWDFTRE